AVFSRPFVGRRMDAIGRKWFLRGGPVLIAISAVGLLFADSLPAVIGLRLVQGLAGSAFYTSAATVATDLAPLEKRADYISRFSLFLYAGFAAGPALGEILIETQSYAWAWWAAVASSIVALAIAVNVPETRPDRPELEGPPARRRWVHPAALGPGLVLLTVAVGYTAISSFTPLYARSIGMGSSGGLYATFAVTILVVRLVSGRLADRFGRAAVAFPGLVSGALGMFVLAAIPRPAAAFVGVALFGAGHALIFPALMALTVDRVSDRERGEALGSFTACFDVGASTGGYLVGFVADAAGFRAAWATPGVLCLLGMVALGVMAGKDRRDPSRLTGGEPDLEPAGT
ncbi:MAG: MFS transporter, partial [Actinomycetota bacterium]|nr:MFS transporter [Actinomycetota bacterium]